MNYIKSVIVSLLAVSMSATAGDIATARTQGATLGIITALQGATDIIKDVVGQIRELENTANRRINDTADQVARIPGVEDIFTLMEKIKGAA